MIRSVHHIVIGLGLTLAVSAAATAQETQETAAQMRARALELPLPESVTDLIERGFDRRQVGFAMQDLYALFAIRHDVGARNDGLSAENRDRALTLSLARRRADLMTTALTYDHDADGTVIAAELHAHFGKTDDYRATELMLVYDLDFDRELTPEELRAGVIRRIDEVSNARLLDQILTWDLDGDGRVHSDEVQMMSDARFRPDPEPGQ